MKKLTPLLLSIVFSLSVINAKSAFGELESTKGSKIDGIEYKFQQIKTLKQDSLSKVKADKKAAEKNLKKANKVLKTTNEVIKETGSVIEAGSNISAEAVKLTEGGNQNKKVKVVNKKIDKGKDAFNKAGTILNTGEKVVDAIRKGKKTAKVIKASKEDIAKARKFWDNFESKQKAIKKKIESAGGYYPYIIKQEGKLSSEEQIAMKIKLEKFVNIKRPKLDDIKILSMDNIDVRGTVSALANSTSGNMQIIFKTLDNSIKAVDELNGLRRALKDRDASAKQKDVTIARARAMQKEIKNKVANEYDGSWDAYIKDRYPNASDEQRKASAAIIKAAAHSEIKNVNTDVGFWESIDVGGSIDALVSNISMLGNKTLDAAAGIYSHLKNIYTGTIDGFALLFDTDGVGDATALKEQSIIRVRVKKESKDWDIEELRSASTYAKGKIQESKDKQLAEGGISLEEWKIRYMVYRRSHEKKVFEKRIAGLEKKEAAAKEKAAAANKATVAKKEKLAQEKIAQKEVEDEESAIDLKDRMDAVFTIMKSPLKVKVNKIKETATHYHGLIISSVFFKENELIINKATGELSITYKLKGKRAPWLICKSATPVLGVYTGRIITNNKHAVDVGYFSFKFKD